MNKADVDKQLLQTTYKLQWEWKQCEAIVESSVEAADAALYNQSLSQAKYLFLLREARLRQVSAAQYL